MDYKIDTELHQKILGIKRRAKEIFITLLSACEGPLSENYLYRWVLNEVYSESAHKFTLCKLVNKQETASLGEEKKEIIFGAYNQVDLAVAIADILNIEGDFVDDAVDKVQGIPGFYELAVKLAYDIDHNMDGNYGIDRESIKSSVEGSKDFINWTDQNKEEINRRK